MEKLIQNYSYHLDYLRKKYNLTVEEFCEGICNERSYRRYLSGERKITPNKIVDFCNKIGISPSDFYYNAMLRERKELSKIRDLYNDIVNFDYSSFYSKLKNINTSRLLNKQNERYLQFCIAKANRETNKIIDSQAVEIVSKICDYPKCLSKEAFDFVDIISLNFISNLEVKIKKTSALEKMIEILNHGLNYISSESKQVLPMIYANTSIYLGRLQRYNESLEISTKGILFSLKHNNMTALSHLRYMKSYCHLILGDIDSAKKEAIKCIGSCICKENKYEYNMFIKALSKDFKFNIISIFSNTDWSKYI